MNPVYKSPRQRLFDNLRQEKLVEEAEKHQEKCEALTVAQADHFLKLANSSLVRRSL